MLKTSRFDTKAARLVLVSLVMAATSLPAWTASSADVGNPVYGSWVALDKESASMRMLSIFTVHPDRIEVKSTCSYQGLSVVAETSAPARVTDREIEVLEARNVEKEHSPGFLRCRASIRPMSMGYEVRGGKLVMSAPGTEKVIELPRAAD